MIRLTVPGVPVAKGSYRAVRGRLLTSTSSGHETNQKLWHKTIVAATWAARDAVPSQPVYTFPTGGVFVGAVFGFPLRLKHFDRAGALRADTPWIAEELDTDKCVRLVCDALTDAWVWRDDRQAQPMACAVYLAPGRSVETTLILGAAVERHQVIRAWSDALDDAMEAMTTAVVTDAQKRAPARRGKKAA